MSANSFSKFCDFLESDLSVYPVREWAVFVEAERLGLSGCEAENAVAIIGVSLDWRKLRCYFNEE